MGYFVSVLRERIANFEAPKPSTWSHGKRPGYRRGAWAFPLTTCEKICAILTSIWTGMQILGGALRHCRSMPRSSPASTLRTEVESALAAINTAHNQVSSDISLAQASADQKIVQSRRAVEIETLKAQAEVEPLQRLATSSVCSKRRMPRRCRFMCATSNSALLAKAQRIIKEAK